ncbi:uncharacterized protein LOC112346929 [Selaginella moellendorffii]|uniref:uncharacterized protein LOC112346929 n=1 Tax=Selaginella moellendorffii TaxID=88036 RepID=UPI000D1C5EAE|nr:uncharacterized protein LOC112346929 [Selaginella moellendorffii]|eukprot:XP_024532658.1 uncharacterized protein LOC112346929 [Selaginella moellendorffii]
MKVISLSLDPLVSSLKESLCTIFAGPHMVATDLSTCVFATATRDHPELTIEVTAALLILRVTGKKISDMVAHSWRSQAVCGYNKKIRISYAPVVTANEFQRRVIVFRLRVTKVALAGIVSCLAFSGHQTKSSWGWFLGLNLSSVQRRQTWSFYMCCKDTRKASLKYSSSLPFESIYKLLSQTCSVL